MKIINDIPFRGFFSNERNKDILSLLLSEIIEEKYEYIYKNIKYLNNHLNIDCITDQKNITDILVEAGKYVIDIEAYTEYNEIKRIKNLVYIMKILGKYYNARNNYINDKRIIQINIIKRKRNNKEYYIRDKEKKYTNKIKIIEINIDIEETLIYTKSEQINKKLWCMLLKSEIEDKDRIIKIIEKMHYSERIKKEMKERMIKYMTEEYLIEIGTTWQDRINLEKASAREKGYHNGIRDSKIILARRLISKNMNFKDISEVTELPIEKIEELSTNVKILKNNALVKKK